MRILLWHGYLLGGTGSNVYTRMLAREWSRAGHDVVVLSQEAHPERYDIGLATAVRPDVGGLLPTFVIDRYEGYVVKRVQECTRPELDGWVDANASVLRDLLPADVVFTNHVLLGGPVGAATGAPFAVKAHGSELEYSMRGNAELSEWGRETLAGARARASAPHRSSSGRPRIEYSSSEPCALTRNVAPLVAPTGPPISTWFANTRSAGSNSRSVPAFASTYARFSMSVKSCKNLGVSPAYRSITKTGSSPPGRSTLTTRAAPMS